MDICITGVNGFIGKILVNTLIKYNKFNIIGIGRNENYLGNEKINYIKADISDKNFSEFIGRKVSNIDVIIHLAAFIKFDNDEELIKVNSLGTLHVCELANLMNVKQLIYMSSIPVIGKPQILPITEEHPLNPSTLYHTTKLAGEYIVSNCCNINIITTIVRISSPIGVGMRKNNILSVFIERSKIGEDIILYGNGGRRQNYVDVRDICNGILQVMEKRPSGVFNICNYESVSNLELAELCINKIGSTSKIAYQGVDNEEDLRWEISIGKAGQVFGYDPKFKVEDTIKWILNNKAGN